MKRSDIELTAMDGNKVYGTLIQPKSPDAAVLMVHGITADRHEWGLFDQIVKVLDDKNIASLAIDYRGHGKSKKKIDQLTLSGVFLDILISMTYLKECFGTKNVKYFLVSNSFGGGVSYIYANYDDCLSGACLCSPVLSYISDLTRVNKNWVVEEKTRGFIDYSGNKLQKFITNEMIFFDQLINKISAKPTLMLIHGNSDKDVPIQESIQFAALKRIQLKEFDNMGHGFAEPSDFDMITDQTIKNHMIVSEFIAEYLEKIINAKT